MSTPQGRDRKPDINKAPNLAIAAGAGLCILLLALMMLATLSIFNHVT